MQKLGKNTTESIFDLYDLKFGMKKEAIAARVEILEGGEVGDINLAVLGAQSVRLFFDHEDRLWQVKATYPVSSPEEAEEILERMSRDYRFQTPSSRVAFELTDPKEEVALLSIRYSEAFMKRAYFHHMMAARNGRCI